jgi:uncharacterized protein YkwD
MGARHTAVAAFAAQFVLLAFCSTASSSAACPGDSAQPTTAGADDVATAIVCDINVYRTSNGLRPLRWDSRLGSAAQAQATDMAARHYASHFTPEGVGLVERVESTGYISKGSNWSLAENLGWGTSYLSTPLAIVQGWIDSPEHRENILDPQVRDIGVGIAQGSISDGGQSGFVYVADFGMRATPVDTLRIHGRAVRPRRR